MKIKNESIWSFRLGCESGEKDATGIGKLYSGVSTTGTQPGVGSVASTPRVGGKAPLELQEKREIAHKRLQKLVNNLLVYETDIKVCSLEIVSCLEI